MVTNRRRSLLLIKPITQSLGLQRPSAAHELVEIAAVEPRTVWAPSSSRLTRTTE